MSLISTANQRVATRSAERRGTIGLYLELSKARLSSMVVLTAAAGFALGGDLQGGLAWLTLLWTLLGTALCAFAANAINQVVEVQRDAMMLRTRRRPLPSGALLPAQGLAFAATAASCGTGILWLAVRPAAALLALATIALYVGLYTPLKPRTPLNTLVGAICGAIPPLLGWVAAGGPIAPQAMVLPAVLFVWQIQHFMALGWMYRADYARGGFAMLPVVDRGGGATGRLAAVSGAALVPLALLATVLGLAGWVYAAGAAALGGWLAFLGARLAARRSDAGARRLFLATLVYLPVLLCLMVVDRA
jgi:protoheme IX farnesyltransferase